MGATVITRIVVYSLPHSYPVGASLEDAVVVVTESYDKNTHPAAPQLGFGFIGSKREFETTYLDCMSHQFDDGITQSHTIKNGAEFRARLIDLQERSSLLTAEALMAHGFRAISWVPELLEVTGTFAPAAPYRSFGLWRLACPLQSDSDVQLMLRQSAAIKAITEDPRDVVWAGRPGALNHMQAAQALGLNNCFVREPETTASPAF